ncbi:MAG: (d)CMP kinase [Candidatus Promineifilaceae bacterium]
MIAIDGPAASGKTTIGRLLAADSGYLLLDTGAMYRVVTLAVLNRGIDPQDTQAVAETARTIEMQLLPVLDEADGRDTTVLLDGKDVTWQLRTQAVDQNVSAVARVPAVREAMVAQQREIGRNGNVIMIGRDIGTVVLPDAPLKLYVVASAEARARRRWEERHKRGDETGYEAILSTLKERDRIDGSRAHSPMVSAEDAHLIDTSDHSPHQVLHEIYQLFETA